MENKYYQIGESAAMNSGNVWIKKVPAHLLYPMMRSENDTYGEVCTPESIRSVINSLDKVAFFDGIIEFKEEGEF